MFLGLGQPSFISPKNIKCFNFFPFGVKNNLFGLGQKSTRVKDGSASYLLRVKSILWSVGSGPISNFWENKFKKMLVGKLHFGKNIVIIYSKKMNNFELNIFFNSI